MIPVVAVGREPLGIVQRGPEQGRGLCLIG